ncbi:MAG: hypothetical protein ABFD49_00080 [Armatimonadota bacterium]|nr:hypothetical protein [bacterium]
MITIQGKPRRDGVAIAVAAVVDSQNGINGVSPKLLEEGLQAIKRQASPQDYPEVVVVCDNIVMGISMRIPGINTIGIAAQAELDVPGLNPEVPCVTGVENLLSQVSQGDIVILDGNSGRVFVDPDPHTLIHYQHIEDQRTSEHKIFIASEHIPARTQTGHTVTVFAYIKNEGEVDQALSEGADGLLLDVRGRAEDADYYKAVMRAAPGKPLVFAADFACAELIKTAARFSGPGQVTVMFPTDSFEELFGQVDPILAEIEADPDAATVDIGTIALGTETDAPILTTTRKLALDLRKSKLIEQIDLEDMYEKSAAWLRGRDPDDVILLIGKHVNWLEKLVASGARCVGVAPDKVGLSKYKIREINEEAAL